MPSAPDPSNLTEAVALLERAIGYGRAALGGVTDDLLNRPTPCRRWDLATLLAHMEDSLAAMSEAAEVGEVGLEPVRLAGGARTVGAQVAVARLRTRACALLGAWTVRVEAAGPIGSGGPLGPLGGDSLGPAGSAGPAGSFDGGPVWSFGGEPTGSRGPVPPDPGRHPLDRGVETLSVGGQPLAAALLVHAGALEVAVHAWDVTRACGVDRPLPAQLANRLLDLAPTVVAEEDRPLRFGAPLPAHPQAGAAERLLAYLGRRL